MTEPADVASAYDSWAAIYDSDRNKTRDLDALVLRGMGFDLTRKDVLELGCGTGKNTAYLTGARSVLALDFSPGMLEKARARVSPGNVRFVQHDVQEPWPTPAAAFDLVVGNLVLEHVRKLAPVFVEAARTTRPGGLVFFCELHPFRQLEGKQAHFIPATGSVVNVTAYPHDVSDYLDAGLAAGLTLVKTGDWRDAPDQPPRLFSTLWRQPLPV